MIYTSENYSSENLSDTISAIKLFHRSVESDMRKIGKGRKKHKIFKYASTKIYHNVETSGIFLSFLNVCLILDAWDKIN